LNLSILPVPGAPYRVPSTRNFCQNHVRVTQNQPIMTTPRVALITGSGKRRLGWHVAEGLAAKTNARFAFFTLNRGMDFLHFGVFAIIHSLTNAL